MTAAPRGSEATTGLPDTVTGTVVTVGSFDGVHRGHHDVLAGLAERARAAGLHSLLLTFDPHPRAVLSPESAPRLLTTTEEKLEALATCGIDYVAVLPFTTGLASYDAEQFVELVLRRRYRMRQLLIGHDHGFGRGRMGDEAMLRAIGRRERFGVEVVPALLLDGGHPVSSSAIRSAVADGDLRSAARALGRSYSVSGRVVHGEKRGRLLGFPTLNLGPISAGKLLPPEGVYAVRAQTRLGEFGGMMNLGPRPTFGDSRVSLEAHLFDAEGDLYGAQVRIDFVERLRGTQKFPDAAALVAQLGRDATAARAALAIDRSGAR